jgi:hypothetical protein
MTRSASTRTARLASLAALAVIAATLVSCAPESTASPSPSPSDAPSVSATPVTTPGPVSDTPTAAPTSPSDAAALPEDCESAFTPALLASMSERGLPLNAPGVTLLSTQQGGLLELKSSLDALHCTWGAPGPVGISTDVSRIDGSIASQVVAALGAAGFACDTSGETTTCEIEQRGVDFDGNEYVRGEEHAVRPDVWISSSWVNVDTAGYLDDILSALDARG